MFWIKRGLAAVAISKRTESTEYQVFLLHLLKDDFISLYIACDFGIQRGIVVACDPALQLGSSNCLAVDCNAGLFDVPVINFTITGNQCYCFDHGLGLELQVQLSFTSSRRIDYDTFPSCSIKTVENYLFLDCIHWINVWLVNRCSLD